MKKQLTPHFVKYVVVTDLLVLVGMIVYNGLSLFIPIVRIRIDGIIVIMLMIDAYLVGMKLKS